MGEMAAALMEGVQGENVIACGKHFAFNSMERSRFKVSVTADKRTEQEVYFPHFRKFVKRGGASIMNAYNLYQGTKCGHNPYLLRKVLKGDWDFDGFVISDFFWGIKSAEGGISSGCDVEIARAEGEAIGMAKGEAIGVAKGEAIGVAKGEAIGMAKGEDRLAFLVSSMVQSGADQESILKASTDPAYRKEMYARYHIE